MKEYYAVVHKDDNSDYSLFFPDIPGCFSAGSTMDEARIMAAEALGMHVEAMTQAGREIFEPSSLEVIRNHEDARDAATFISVPLSFGSR